MVVPRLIPLQLESRGVGDYRAESRPPPVRVRVRVLVVAGTRTPMINPSCPQHRQGRAALVPRVYFTIQMMKWWMICWMVSEFPLLQLLLQWRVRAGALHLISGRRTMVQWRALFLSGGRRSTVAAATAAGAGAGAVGQTVNEFLPRSARLLSRQVRSHGRRLLPGPARPHRRRLLPGPVRRPLQLNAEHVQWLQVVWITSIRHQPNLC